MRPVTRSPPCCAGRGELVSVTIDPTDDYLGRTWHRGNRLHDLRHTAATLWLSSGVHFMQVSKWLGHSAFTLTLDVYGDYIPEVDGGVVNPLPEPTAPAKQAELPSNVVNLFGRQSS